MSLAFGFALPHWQAISGGAGGPSLALDFVNNVSFDPRITFTRASTGTYFDSAGVLQSAAVDQPRLDYDPVTLAAQGLLIEEQRVNSIRNNTMQGAVAGTPGTLPTNWTGTGSPVNGLTRQVVGTGTESGITYVDIRYSGTATATAFHAINEEPIGAIAAASGQTWTHTAYISVAAGSTANINAFDIGINEYSSVPAFLTGSSTTIVISSGALSSKRYTLTRTLTNASTASVHPFMAFTYNNGAAIDITLRIGLPQLELGAFATSVIPTTTAAVTRAADVASVNTLSPWYNATEGTLFAESSRSALGSSGQLIVAEFGSTANNNDNIIQLGTQFATTNFQFLVNTAGVNQVALVGAGTTAVAKYAFAYKANDFAYTKNGSVPLTDASGSVPTVVQLNIGSRPAFGNTGFLNGHIRCITYYPRRLSDAELQAITA